MKELSEMTLEELWQLFPIILKEHNPKYKDWYETERKNLCERFKENILRINHIGSTAVKGLIAKPTVDILMEISLYTDIDKLKNELKDMRWILMNSSESPEFRLTFNKGYTKYGFAEKVYHLHVRYIGNYDELYFRDYLKDHEETAREYEKLKLSLWKKFEHDRDGYTDAKREFVLRVSKQAKEEYKDRYKLKYVFSYWYEYGGCCLWSKNEAAYNKYGIGGISNKRFPISDELKNELYKLEDEYQYSLNWDYPPDPSPWTKEQWNDFKEKATKTYYKLCKELGDQYEVINNLDDCIFNNEAL